MRRLVAAPVRLHHLQRTRQSLAVKSARTYASVTDLSNYPKPGEQLHGFLLRRSKQVPELELTALHFEHVKTGAEYLHIARDDQNNVFSIGFKTNPPDATGVPHILEHTTLCGSEKYPVRDPFFKMMPRSLSNFMNAFTSSDHTTYPFATTNPQDFKNLMSVYMDSTLHPLLKEHDFTQEGWRLGPENPEAVKNGEESETIFKGVVYNEMKGQMSDASYLYYIRFFEHLFPALNNSGGDPQRMTDLTYEQLKKFHADHYHPSNSKIMTYGNMALAEHLESIGKQLNHFDRIAPDSEVKRPMELSSGPRTVTIKGPLDPLMPPDSQFKTSVTWLMGEPKDVVENFSLSLMSSLLMDGYGSPLYRNLIEAGLGTDWTPNTGYDSSAGRAIFSVGLNGVKEENVARVSQAISKTLEEVREKGFEQHKIDGILHQLELSLKHKTASFGMSMMQRLKPSWFNGVDVFDALAWQRTVDGFKSEMAKGGYLESLLDKYLLTDKTMTFTMQPFPTYGQELLTEEAARLARKIQEANEYYGTPEHATKQIREREMELVAQQNTESDLSSLPTVHVADIPRRKDSYTLRDAATENRPTQWREAPTNGLTYFRALSIFKDLPFELRTFVPLFCDAVMRIGTKNKSMEEIEDMIKLKTGGVSLGYHSCSSPADTKIWEEGLTLSGFALDRNVSSVYDILGMLITETDFDGPKAHRMIAELLQSAASGAADGVAESGHSFARRFAEAGLTAHGRVLEQTGGITQIANITRLASHPELQTTIASELLKALKMIQTILIANRSSMRMALTCGAEATSGNQTALDKFIRGTFSDSSVTNTAVDQLNIPLKDWTASINNNRKTIFPLPYQVTYSALALPTVPYSDSQSASLAILAQLLTHKHLHREIREKGGAYGGGAYSRALDGVFGYYSYRDPNPANTARIMQEAGNFARDKQWSDRDIEEAKLSVFQAIDAPRSVSEEGMTKFVSGVTPEMEQKRREQLLDVNAEQVREVASKFLVDGIGNSRVVVLGERKPFMKDEDGWKAEELGMSPPAAEQQQEVDATQAPMAAAA